MSLSPNTSRLLRGLVIGIVVALACPSPAKAQTAGSPFQIQNPNSNLDWIASAYAPPAGVFLVAWEDGGVSGAQNIYGRLYDLSGAPMSPQFNICDNCGTPSGTGPHIAFDGTNFLVVWRDARDSSLFGFAGTEGFNIYGQFVDTTGGTVGANFLISDWDGGVLVDQRGPALAFDGVNYLVVFEEDNGFGNFGISGTRVNTNAASPTIIDSASPIVFRSPIVDEDALDPWVDWNGSAGMYLVTWDVDAGSGPSVEWEVQGRSIDPAATLGSVVNITSVAGSTQRFGGAVSDQTTGKWVVVWSDNRNDVSPPYDSYQAWAQAIDIDGVTLLGSNTQITTDDMWDRHASGGVDSDGIGMIAWADGGSGGPRTLKGRRLKLDGSGIAFVGNVFDIAPARPQISTQSASFGDNGSLSAFLVTWWDSSENILWGQMVLPSLQASAVMPNSGAAAGGDSVQLDGHGFTQSATVTIDGNPLGSPFVPPDGTTFSGITPAGTLGSWDVFIDNGDGQTWTITSGFTYTNDKIFNGTQVNGFWSDAANWSPAGVPVSTDSVFFPSGVPFAPVFDLASAQVVNVTIGSGAVLNFMASPRTLSVSGNWTNDGSLSAMPSATVDFNGSGVQLVNGVTMFPTVSITGGGTVKIEPGGVMWAPGYTQASCCTVMVLGGGELAIQTGTIDGMVDVWAGGILEYFSSLTVNATGTVNLNPGSQLLGDNTASMMVLGTFQSAGALVSSLSPGTKRYTLTLDGVVDVVGTSFDSPESSGLIISSTAAIAGFSGNSFTGAVSGGTHLRVEQVGPFSMTAPGCTFDDSFGPGIGSNVTAEDFSAPANVTVAFPSSSGVGAGESYDNEIGGAVISWNAAPQIWDIYPEFGPTGGGTVVTITGYDFDPGSTVYFGASPASSTSVLSPYEIQAVSPSGSSGEVDLFVYNPDNQSDMTHFVYSTSTSVQIGVSGGSTANDYRMYSVPAFMTGSQIIDAMESQLGPYDSTQWRCYRHESDWGYMEWPSFWDQPDSDPMGRAIWIISRNPVSLNFSGYSTGVVSEFTVDLEIGWNQIGTPYNSAVAWSSVLAQDVDPVTHDFVGSPEPVTSSSLVGSTLYAYDGNGYVASSSLAPGAGYWVYNAAGHNISLRVPSPGGATKPSSAPIYSGLSAATPLPPPPPGGTVAGASGVSAPSASLPAARASDTGGAASSSSGVGAASGGGGGGGGGCFAGSASAGSIAGMAASLSAVMVALLLFQLTVFARRLPGNR